MAVNVISLFRFLSRNRKLRRLMHNIRSGIYFSGNFTSIIAFKSPLTGDHHGSQRISLNGWNYWIRTDLFSDPATYCILKLLIAIYNFIEHSLYLVIWLFVQWGNSQLIYLSIMRLIFSSRVTLFYCQFFLFCNYMVFESIDQNMGPLHCSGELELGWFCNRFF